MVAVLGFCPALDHQGTPPCAAISTDCDLSVLHRATKDRDHHDRARACAAAVLSAWQEASIVVGGTARDLRAHLRDRAAWRRFLKPLFGIEGGRQSRACRADAPRAASRSGDLLPRAGRFFFARTGTRFSPENAYMTAPCASASISTGMRQTAAFAPRPRAAMAQGVGHVQAIRPPCNGRGPAGPPTAGRGWPRAISSAGGRRRPAAKTWSLPPGGTEANSASP